VENRGHTGLSSLTPHWHVETVRAAIRLVTEHEREATDGLLAAVTGLCELVETGFAFVVTKVHPVMVQSHLFEDVLVAVIAADHCYTSPVVAGMHATVSDAVCACSPPVRNYMRLTRVRVFFVFSKMP